MRWSEEYKMSAWLKLNGAASCEAALCRSFYVAERLTLSVRAQRGDSTLQQLVDGCGVDAVWREVVASDTLCCVFDRDFDRGDDQVDVSIGHLVEGDEAPRRDDFFAFDVVSVAILHGVGEDIRLANFQDILDMPLGDTSGEEAVDQLCAGAEFRGEFFDDCAVHRALHRPDLLAVRPSQEESLSLYYTAYFHYSILIIICQFMYTKSIHFLLYCP